jgi:hypothetical protein
LLSQFLTLVSQGAISIVTNGLAGPISLAASGLRANRATPNEAMDRPQKKFCWMKKNAVRNAAAIEQIDTHRANHPNQLVIRDRFSDPKFRF